MKIETIHSVIKDGSNYLRYSEKDWRIIAYGEIIGLDDFPEMEEKFQAQIKEGKL